MQVSRGLQARGPNFSQGPHANPIYKFPMFDWKFSLCKFGKFATNIAIPCVFRFLESENLQLEQMNFHVFFLTGNVSDSEDPVGC